MGLELLATQVTNAQLKVTAHVPPKKLKNVAY
jgi:hypothetical protein